MIFSSYTFIFVFLPLVLLGYAAAGRIWGKTACKIWLVGASLVFYSHTNRKLFLLLAGTILFNHLCVTVIQRFGAETRQSRISLACSIAGNLGLLFYFKYSNFFLQNINRFAGTGFALRNIILPLGISFFTFQIISYVIDVYRGKYKAGNLLDFSLFVTFFPQLIVGPVIRYDEMEPQINSDTFGKFDKQSIIEGIILFTIGCVKKSIIADPLITHAQAFYAGSYYSNIVMAWSGVLAYTFAYYFDFSGYIDMALGLGRFFNIKLPQNFNSPYKSVDFADFWRRWNMSISLFFNDYIFKSIFKFGDRYGKLILATMTTFLVSGIWHGAGWHFIAWGLFNGVLVCIANIMTLKRKKFKKPLGWSLTFFSALMARVLFDSGNVGQAIQVYKLMFDIRPLFRAGALTMARSYISEHFGIVLLMAACAGICFFLPNSNEIIDKYKPKPIYAALCGFGFAAALFFMGSISNFLYFQF